MVIDLRGAQQYLNERMSMQCAAKIKSRLRTVRFWETTMKISPPFHRAARAAIALALGTCAYAAPALAHNVGDWVLAPWHDSTQTFPGVVVGKSGSSLTIRFDDGTRETRIASEVRAFDWKAGSYVECQWSDGKWYGARINWLGKDGLSMQIRYVDDGTIERTTTGKCRSSN